MKQKYAKLISWIMVIFWMIVIFLFSSQNADDSTQTSSASAKLLETLLNSLSGIFSEKQIDTLTKNCQLIVRKIAHFSEYAILGMFSCNALTKYDFHNKKTVPLVSSAICLVYAISDEIHQYLVPERACRFTDVLIDFSGAVFGISFLIIILSIIKKGRSNA